MKRGSHILGSSMVAINVQKITGKWIKGVALDVHTLSSTYRGINEAGYDEYETKRSEIGELLYRLKYQNDQSVAAEIIATATAFLNSHRRKFDIIVPVPPSGIRSIQPVITLAKGIGAALGVPVVECVRTTRAAAQLKGVQDAEKRRELLAGLHEVDAAATAGKNILLFDDLYRSGATMNAITELLMQHGKAASVRALAITKTRSNQ
jgi:competence protein ComFC